MNDWRVLLSDWPKMRFKVTNTKSTQKSIIVTVSVRLKIIENIPLDLFQPQTSPKGINLSLMCVK